MMLARGAIIVWAIAVTFLPVTPAPAAEAAPGTLFPLIDDVLPQPASASAKTTSLSR